MIKVKRKSEINFVDNLILYEKVFKDVISNLFIKSYITQHNVYNV